LQYSAQLEKRILIRVTLYFSDLRHFSALGVRVSTCRG
jgi:hypothetical protein